MKNSTSLQPVTISGPRVVVDRIGKVSKSTRHAIGLAMAATVLAACSSGGNSSIVPVRAIPASERSNAAALFNTQSQAQSLFAQGDATGKPPVCKGRNLIADGSFESPAIPAGGYQVFGVGGTFGPWTVIGPPGGSLVLLTSTTVSSGYTFNAQSGVQSFDLTVSPNYAVGLQQTVNLQRKHKYSLCFWIGNINQPKGVYGTTSTDIVKVNGSIVNTSTNSAGVANSGVIAWRQFGTTFVAAGGPTTISFNNGDPTSDNYNGLDSIVLVP